MKTIFTRYYPVLLFILLFPISSVLRADISTHTILDGGYRFAYDHISLPDNEKMGLLSGNYLLDVNEYVYFGLGIYGAVHGKRGGFFTGGLEAGLKYPFRKGFGLDLGYFVGGGGGGAAPQGGGLMLRPHLNLTYSINNYAYALGVTRVDFPNGDISSDQLTLSVERQFQSIFLPGKSSVGQNTIRGHTHKRIFLPEILAYFPFSGTLGTEAKVQDRRMDVIGIRWREHWGNGWWGDFGTGGAWGGEADGFAQVFIGGARELALIPSASLFLGMQLGAAGGGRVHTGGGVIGRVSLTSLYQLNEDWNLMIEGGWLSSVDGEFSGLLASAGIAYDYDIFRPEGKNKKTQISRIHDVQWADFRIRAGIQRYAHYLKGNGRKTADRKAHPVDQVHTKIDVFAHKYVFFTGQALGAFDGEVGGYAVGLIGPGLYLPVLPRLAISLEGLVGAAGGGGIASGGGRILQPMLSVDIRISKSLELEIGGGYIKAMDGDLEAWIVDAGIGFNFAVPHRLN